MFSGDAAAFPASDAGFRDLMAVFALKDASGPCSCSSTHRMQLLRITTHFCMIQVLEYGMLCRCGAAEPAGGRHGARCL